LSIQFLFTIIFYYMYVIDSLNHMIIILNLLENQKGSVGMTDSTFNLDTEILDLNGAEDVHQQDLSELEALTTRINELAANMIKREICLKDELEAKKGDIASITASFENSQNEIAELHKQIAEMRATNEKNQTLIGGLSGLVAEQEMQLQGLKEVIGSKEQIIRSFAVSLENSKKEITELHKQVEEMKATNENQETLLGEYKEKLDSLIGEVSLLTNQKSESPAEESPALKAEPNTQEENLVLKAEPIVKEENSVLKNDRKAQKKKLKKLLKQNPNANEMILAELLGVDSSYIIGLRKEFDI
jgi:chromosome segregation ATPase